MCVSVRALHEEEEKVRDYPETRLECFVCSKLNETNKYANQAIIMQIAPFQDSVWLRTISALPVTKTAAQVHRFQEGIS